MVKILITGICGMVASHLADLLIEKGHQVIGTYRWQEDMSNIEHIKDKIKLVPMNLNDLSSCISALAIAKPDAISHLAAESYVSDSFNFPHEAISVNTLGTLNLLEAVKFLRDASDGMIEGFDEKPKENEKLRFNPVIHICSSSEVYGLVKKEDVPIKETQAFNPANPYAVGKCGADHLAQMYFNNYGLKTIRTRMFSHTSRRRKMLSAEVNFARQIARIEKGLQEPIVKHGNLNSIRTWAHVQDAIDAYYLILTKPVKFGEVYNIGGIDAKTIEESLLYLISLAKTDKYIKTELDTTLLRKYDVTLQLPDISKFQKDYPKWKAKWKFEEIMLDVLEGQRECLKEKMY